MKTKILCFFSIIVMLMAACNKNESPAVKMATTTDMRALSSQSILTSAAANPQNPYDYIGYEHNIVLDSLRHYAKVNSDTTRRGTYAYLTRYFKNNFGADVRLSYDPNERLACTDYQALWFNQKISALAMAYWHSLSDAVQGIKDLDHYDSFKQQVVAIENKINADKLAADQKKNLLMTSSILRYSGYYWINAFNNGEVVYHNEGGGMAMPESFLRKVAGVIVGICADASVVAAGYVSGDYSIIGEAGDWSFVCGYGTGWY
jgi:hypothetical protein